LAIAIGCSEMFIGEFVKRFARLNGLEIELKQSAFISMDMHL